MTSAGARQSAWSLVVACARHAAGTVDAAAVRLAAHDVTDWDEALSLTRRHRLIPWLARALSLDGIPSAVSMLLAQEAAVGGARTLAQVSQLTRIVTALKQADVAALPYKGPVLSLQLYGDLALRTSTDLDIVVARASYVRAREILLAEGYFARGGHSIRRERALFGGLGHAAFEKDGHDLVELHWHFAPRPFPFALSIADAMRHSTAVPVAGVQLMQLRDDDLIATLAMHGMRHLFEQLEWLAGFARLLQRTPLSAEQLLWHAGRLGARRMVLTSVAVAEQLLAFEPASDWRAALLHDSESVALAAIIAGRVRDEASARRPLPEHAELQLLYARMLDSRRDRLRLLTRAALLPTEREWEWVRLPDALSALYHIVRPVRMLVEHARRSVPRGRA